MDDDWMILAACRGRTQDMFPTTDSGYVVTLSGYVTALSICSTCPVINQCLDYALQFPPQDMYGIWAGMDKRGLMQEQLRRAIKPIKSTYRQTVTLTDEHDNK